MKKSMGRNGVFPAIILLILCLAGGLAGCAKEAEETVAEKTQLVLWHYWDLPYARQALGQMVDGFNAENPDTEIRLRYVPDEDFKKQLSLAMADGTMPDIALMDSSDVQYFNATGYLVDVTDVIEKEAYLDVAIASCLSKDGRLSGIPVGVNCLAFYYNQDLLEAAGIRPPRTLEEFVTAAERLSDGDVYGCAFPSLQSEESLFCFLPILWANGGSLDEINSADSRRAFDILRRLSDSGAMSPGTVDMTLGDVAREFKRGKIAMMFTTTMSVQSLENEKLDFQFQVTHLPVEPEQFSVVGGEVLAVTKGEHQDVGRAFLRYMADPERIRLYIDGMGYLAPQKDVLEWQLKQNPKLKQYVDILETARTRDFTPYWPKVSLAVADTVNQVILRKDTSDTIEKLAEKIKRIREGLE